MDSETKLEQSLDDEPSALHAVDEMAAPPPDPDKPSPTADQMENIAEDKILAFFSYLSILFLVPLLMRRASKFCQYHARQGMVLFGLWFIILEFGWSAQYISTGLAVFLKSFHGIATIIYIIIGEVNVWQEQMKPLPLFGKLVDRIYARIQKKKLVTPE